MSDSTGSDSKPTKSKIIVIVLAKLSHRERHVPLLYNFLLVTIHNK